MCRSCTAHGQRRVTGVSNDRVMRGYALKVPVGGECSVWLPAMKRPINLADKRLQRVVTGRFRQKCPARAQCGLARNGSMYRAV
jgi:hypothetical protein